MLRKGTALGGAGDEMKSNNEDLCILFIDDEPILRHVAMLLLKKRFSSVFTAEQGKKGLELFKLHKPDIVITDVHMPEMDGIELSQEIRKLCSRTPIIIVSANYYSFAERLNTAGRIRFIQKPFDMSMLFQAIEDFCGHDFPAEKAGTFASRGNDGKPIGTTKTDVSFIA